GLTLRSPGTGRQSRFRRHIRRWRRTNRTSCLTSHFNKDAPVSNTQLLTISRVGGNEISASDFLWDDPFGQRCSCRLARPSLCSTVGSRSESSPLHHEVFAARSQSQMCPW